MNLKKENNNMIYWLSIIKVIIFIIGCKVIKMEVATSAISVQVDIKDKERANNILKSLGLNMSTFVNMAIKQLIYTDGLPFEVKKSEAR